jgi:hypothetical protein
LRKQQKFPNIFPLHSRSPKRGPPFSSPIYSYSFQKSFLISKFERDFEAIRINKIDCKETLRRYNFRKPRREGGPNEQVDSISISDFEEELQKDNLQQEQQVPLHQEEPT